MSIYYHRFQKNKYGAVRQTVNGIKYDSKKEASKAMELEMMKKGGAIKDYQPHVRLSLDVNGSHICDYIIDFVVEALDGSKEYLEIKSPVTITPAFKLKWKLAQALITDQSIKWVIET